MNVTLLACPHCTRQFRALPDVLGTTIRCRGCRRTFRVPAATDANDLKAGGGMPPLATATAVAAEGFFSGTAVRSCPMCGHTFPMQPRLEGKAIRCRKCRSTFRVFTQAEREPPAVGAIDSVSAAAVAAPPPEAAAVGVAAALEQPFNVPHDDAYADHDDLPLEPQPRAPEACPSPWRPRSAAGLGEAIAVLVGGLLAFPVTLLICWWGMDWDPFGVAPRLRPELRWLAPPHLVAGEGRPAADN